MGFRAVNGSPNQLTASFINLQHHLTYNTGGIQQLFQASCRAPPCRPAQSDRRAALADAGWLANHPRGHARRMFSRRHRHSRGRGSSFRPPRIGSSVALKVVRCRRIGRRSHRLIDTGGCAAPCRPAQGGARRHARRLRRRRRRRRRWTCRGHGARRSCGPSNRLHARRRRHYRVEVAALGRRGRRARHSPAQQRRGEVRVNRLHSLVRRRRQLDRGDGRGRGHALALAGRRHVGVEGLLAARGTQQHHVCTSRGWRRSVSRPAAGPGRCWAKVGLAAVVRL